MTLTNLCLDTLPDLCLSITNAIRQLEAIRGGDELLRRLEDENIAKLLGDELLTFYQRIVNDLPTEVSKFHAFWIDSFLEEVRRMLSTPKALFDGEDIVTDLATTNHFGDPVTITHALVRVQYNSQAIDFREHHILTARWWGIGIIPHCEEARELLTHAILNHARFELAKNLNDLRKTEDAVPYWKTLRVPDRTRAAEPFAFERLVLDVLNEREPLARKAALFEDLFQKTDLRVRVLGLKRNRGERVQISYSYCQEKVEEKRSQIAHSDEVVLLAPWTLATAVFDHERSGAYPEIPWDEFWYSLNSLPASREELAFSIHQIFAQGLATPRAHPRGPSGLVPVPLRILMKSFIENEARKCHENLRQREACRGTRGYKFMQSRYR